MSLNSPSTTAVPFQSGAGLETGKEGKEKKEMKVVIKSGTSFSKAAQLFYFLIPYLAKIFSLLLSRDHLNDSHTHTHTSKFTLNK